jgi:hypothetical protein
VLAAVPGHRPRMTKKRVLAAFLWLWAGWYMGAILAHFLGLSPALGPVLGIAAAALIAGDPRGIIWTQRVSAPSLHEASSEEYVELPRAA